MSDQRLSAAKSSPEVRITEAARALYLEKGYAGVSTEELAKAAAVSKSTLYKYFGDMSGVLKAVVNAEADSFETDVSTKPEDWQGFRSAMVGYGTSLLHFLNDKEIILLDRLMHEQARGHHDVAAVFYKAAYDRTCLNLTKAISQAEKLNLYTTQTPADPGILADCLINMWEGLSYTQARLGLLEKPFPDPEGHAALCFDLLFAPKPQ